MNLKNLSISEVRTTDLLFSNRLGARALYHSANQLWRPPIYTGYMKPYFFWWSLMVFYIIFLIYFCLWLSGFSYKNIYKNSIVASNNQAPTHFWYDSSLKWNYSDEIYAWKFHWKNKILILEGPDYPNSIIKNTRKILVLEQYIFQKIDGFSDFYVQYRFIPSDPLANFNFIVISALKSTDRDQNRTHYRPLSRFWFSVWQYFIYKGLLELVRRRFSRDI